MAANQQLVTRRHLLLLLPPLLVLLLASHHQAAASDPLVTTMHGMRARSLLQAPKLDCPKVCYGRCSNNWKNEMCNDKCNVCCKRCNCVPPGTGQDTRHICPCYDTMINPHNGKLKCP
ncbi:gibberellin-regulated protein 2-like isoform X2 [Lolium rigidum]|uniref:gibberellin-regulated protein 2-like n=1 Tax=Lolium rigidum TaxID=89674 RepID=UPI001F5C291C|nr:gibberellin-regulated protein 2-like [Lolium rigidum]XP_047073340.1 gibberellin-regulated protein 2-like isoform X2 [Lolium rigidum]XP_051200713.1 gibberellin-regulated protein 2-like [Lolium perenne]